MSLPSPRDQLASTVAAEAAPSVAAGVRETAGTDGPTTALVMGDTSDGLAEALTATGQSVTRWHRQLTVGQIHTAWPPSGAFGQVWVRLPRSGLEVKMLLAAAASRVTPEGVVAVYGAKDEGIRSVDKHTPASLSPFETHLVKRRCRVMVAKPRGIASEGADDRLEAWRTETTIDWGVGPRPWTFYPGMFAHGRLDPGTALLIRSLPTLPAGARVLDFGAGTGVIGAAVRGLTNDAELTLIDSDALALAAAEANMPPDTQILAGTDLSPASGPYDLIVSNPPIHDGKRETLKFVTELCRGSAPVLTRKGRLMMVVQRRLPIESVLTTSFRASRIVADEGPFRVWEATGGSGAG
ncbi:MAG: methyltransferase [Longimicrobiales bacterium]